MSCCRFVDTEIRGFSEPEGVNATTEVQPRVQARGGEFGPRSGVAVVQAARDLDLHENVLLKWVREAEADFQSAFPGNGQMKPEQREIERLRRELARRKAKRDILKKLPCCDDRLNPPRPTLPGTRYEVRVRRKASRDAADEPILHIGA
jgi:transposase-like protein